MPTFREYVSSEQLGRCYNRYVVKLTTDKYVPREQFWESLVKPPGQLYWLEQYPDADQPTLIDGVPHWVYKYGFEVDSSD